MFRESGREGPAEIYDFESLRGLGKGGLTPLREWLRHCGGIARAPPLPPDRKPEDPGLVAFSSGLMGSTLMGSLQFSCFLTGGTFGKIRQKIVPFRQNPSKSVRIRQTYVHFGYVLPTCQKVVLLQ